MHPSILKIKQLFKNTTVFYFEPVDEDLITKEIQNLGLTRSYHIVFQLERARDQGTSNSFVLRGMLYVGEVKLTPG